MAHIQEILTALHPDPIHTEYCSFRSKEASTKVQDLVIDRSDDFVDIIGIKYSLILYEKTKEEREKIERRVSRFMGETKTRKEVQTDLVTTIGYENNRNTDVIQR